MIEAPGQAKCKPVGACDDKASGVVEAYYVAGEKACGGGSFYMVLGKLLVCGGSFWSLVWKLLVILLHTELYLRCVET
jgi:hypothetical protein